VDWIGPENFLVAFAFGERRIDCMSRSVNVLVVANANANAMFVDSSISADGNS
jgi:hypothetical protein